MKGQGISVLVLWHSGLWREVKNQVQESLLQLRPIENSHSPQAVFCCTRKPPSQSPRQLWSGEHPHSRVPCWCSFLRGTGESRTCACLHGFHEGCPSYHQRRFPCRQQSNKSIDQKVCALSGSRWHLKSTWRWAGQQLLKWKCITGQDCTFLAVSKPLMWSLLENREWNSVCTQLASFTEPAGHDPPEHACGLVHSQVTLMSVCRLSGRFQSSLFQNKIVLDLDSPL